MLVFSESENLATTRQHLWENFDMRLPPDLILRVEGSTLGDFYFLKRTN
jgi:hypothetical protein